MKSSDQNSRRNFLGLLASGAIGTGLSMFPESLLAKAEAGEFFNYSDGSSDSDSSALNESIKATGKMQHPVCYDVSQANHWGFIWSNVYYMTNAATDTPENELGVMNVLRHHGMLFAMNDETITKYKLGEFFSFNDPVTKKPTLRNPYYTPEDGVFPLPGLAGIKDLQSKGATFCVCDMARKVNAMFVAKQQGLDQEDVYNDFVKGTLPGIMPAPSGVWVLGRLAENRIGYIDASVG